MMANEGKNENESFVGMESFQKEKGPEFFNEIKALNGAGWRARTPGLLITNQPLYHLS